MSFNLSDSSLIFAKFVKNLFQRKLFSFAALRNGYVSVSVCRAYPLAGIEPLYDGFNFKSCVLTMFDKFLNIWFC